MLSNTGRNWLGILAVFLGALAVAVSMLPFWVLPLIDRPEPVDKVVVDTAQAIKGRLIAIAKGTPPPHATPRNKTAWPERLALAAVSLGIATMILSAVSFVAREPWRFAAAGAALGSVAILFQLSIWVAYALLGMLFLWIVLNNLEVLTP